MDQDDLLRELKRLADRVARLEAQLNLPPSPPPDADQPAPETELPEPPDVRETSEPALTTPLQEPPPPPPQRESLASDLVEKRREKQKQVETGAPAPGTAKASPEAPAKAPPLAPPPSTPPKPPAPEPAAPASSPPVAPPTRVPSMPPVERPRAPKAKDPLEMIIGGRWAAWLGAAAVFAAALFAVKIAIDQGWWGRLSPLAKALTIATCGGLVTASGELILRKVNRAASIGLFSAGIGVLYLDAFATFRYWDLLSREWAFVLMGVVAVGGFALTYRTRALTIGILSIVGGYLTPILLRGQTQHDVEMLSYLSMLLAISLGLSGYSPRPFSAMRYVALGCLSFVALGWLVSNGPALWIMGIVFMSIWWTMILAESVIAAAREHSTRGNIVMTLLATAAYSTAGCWILSAGPVAGTDWMGGFTAMVALLAAVVALYFGPGVDGLRAFPRHAIDKLAVSLWVQAGILLATAVALHFDDWGRAAGWLVVGLGAIETGRRLPSKGLDIFGLVVGGIALVDVALFSWNLAPGLTNTIRQFGDVTITGWSILALCAIGVTLAGAHRINDHWPNHWKVAPIVLASIAVIGWLGWWLVQAHGLLVTTGWLIGVAALLLAQRFTDRQRYFELGQLLLLAAAARWVVVDLVRDRFAPTWDPFATLPVINARTALALAIALAGWWVYMILRRQERTGASRRLDGYGFQLARQTAVLFIVLIALLGLSFDIDRIVVRIARGDAAIGWVVGHVRQNLLTLLWSVGSLVLGLLGRLVTQRPVAGGKAPPRVLTLASTIILGICVFKWVVFDTLYWITARGTFGPDHLLPVANVQMLTGLVVAMAGLLLRKQLFAYLEASIGEDAAWGWRDPAAWVPAAAAVIILWGASFEVDRIISRVEAHAQAPLAYAPVLLRALWLTGLWTLGGFVMTMVGWRQRLWVLMASGSALIAAGAITWLTYDTLGWRITHDALDVPVVLNLQCLMGVAVMVLVIGTGRTLGRIIPFRLRQLYGASSPVGAANAFATAMGLWLGTLELDRLFAGDITVRLASFSVWWGLYGVALVAVGFAKRLPPARYAGLGLLAITAGKVLLIDMAEAKNIWRVVSFLACGLLLIVTSIAYAKLGQMLKGEEEEIHHGGAEGTEGE